jgi:hypothetical protein
MYRFVAIAATALSCVILGCGDSTNRPTDAARTVDSGGSAKTTTPAVRREEDDVQTRNDSLDSRKSIDVTYIGPDFFAAAVIHPARLARLPVIGDRLKDQFVGGTMRQLGIRPADIEQLIALMPAETSKPSGTSRFPVFIIRFAHAVNVKVLMAKFQEAVLHGPRAEPLEASIAAKTCYRFSAAPWCVVHAPTPTTVILCADHYMEKVLATRDPSGPLVERLKKANVDNDVIVAVALDEISRIDELFADAKVNEHPVAQAHLDAAKLLQGGCATLNFTGGSVLHAVFDVKNVAAADTIEKLITDDLKTAASIPRTMAALLSPQQQALAAPVLEMENEVLNGATVKNIGTQVTVEIKRSAKIDEAAKKVVAMVKDYDSAARRATHRTQTVINLQQISLAIFGYETANGTFPPAVIEKDGKPLLSWRVAILPFLGEDQLYKQFRLDEAWDSPHNLEAAKAIPSVYEKSSGIADGKTMILAVTGKDQAFDGGKGIDMADRGRSAAGAIMLVETGPDKAAFWSKPEDLSFQAGTPLAALLGHLPDDGFYAVYGNGSLVRIGVDNERLKPFITPSGDSAPRKEPNGH